MWPRETTVRSGDIGAESDSSGPGQSLWGFAAEQSEAGRSEKLQCLWRPARVVSAYAVSGTKPPAVVWRMAGSILRSDVAAQ